MGCSLVFVCATSTILEEVVSRRTMESIHPQCDEYYKNILDRLTLNKTTSFRTPTQGFTPRHASNCLADDVISGLPRAVVTRRSDRAMSGNSITLYDDADLPSIVPVYHLASSGMAMTGGW